MFGREVVRVRGGWKFIQIVSSEGGAMVLAVLPVGRETWHGRRCQCLLMCKKYELYYKVSISFDSTRISVSVEERIPPNVLFPA
jgi:hypothetical protein